MEVSKHCKVCADYNRLDCFGVGLDIEPKCYRFMPQPPQKLMVEIPFMGGTLFAFERHYRDERQFDILKPRLILGDNNYIQIELEFPGFTIYHTVENYEKLRELGTAYHTIEECKKKFSTCKFYMDEKEVDINTLE